MLNRLFPKLNRSQLELFRVFMYYVGTDTDRKFNVPGFWPDPETTNKIPKEPHEIKAELARMKKEALEKRKKLEEKLINEYGLNLDEEREKLINKK
ncbi:hypothetical protein WICMUC_005525 [Wickerhamomyces mucosus]|uniref:Uncharacterized protein n=1 Tax=Wickerhamomyces mucosus TaxID=1378264 RepID=A0A9P8T577_9ASCO|nr:hypothetical protein WICMUC_005525 [Wickerhamomyces mucosus]